MFAKIAVHARHKLDNTIDFLDILKQLHSCSKEIFLTSQAQNHVEKKYPAVNFADAYDIFVILGGDGSVISVARRMKNFSTPLLPISAGRLGFLAEIPPENFSQACQQIEEKAFTEDKRSLLHVCVTTHDGEQKFFHALNDAVVSQSSVARLVSIKTFIDGEYLTTYRADGLIIATPTGSTAYSLSAGGAIVYPQLHALILTPVCPHSLSHRSLVLPHNKGITAMADDETREPLVLTIDGQVPILLEKGDRVDIKISTDKITFLRLPDEHFFKTIKRKMHWGEELCQEK